MYLASLAKCAIEVPKMIRFGSKGDSIEEARIKMMRNLFDYKNFDVFLGTPFGKYLLEGINDDEKIRKQGITKVSEYISVNKTFYKAMKRAKLDACMLDRKDKTKKTKQEEEDDS